MYTFESKSQSIRAVWLILFELSILYRLQRASKLTWDPGNFSLAKIKVSIISFLSLSFPLSNNSLFKCARSNSALWIINLLSFINSKKSSSTSLNFFCFDKNSSEYPWILNAFSETFLSGFK